MKQGDMQQTALCEVPSLAVAAHELKAPLALMRQLALVLQEEDGLSGIQAQKTLERLTLTSERSLRLVEMITRHARLEDSLFELEPVHVGRICEEVAHELAPLCKANSQRLELRMPRRSALAVANRDLLRSIIVGLCDNALSQNAPDRPIIIKVAQQNAAVRVGVRDFGPLVSVGAFRQLRQRLGRQAQPLGNRPNSSGLGLYIAGQFAEAMHGKLGAVQHRSGGATFYLDTQASAQLSFLSS